MMTGCFGRRGLLCALWLSVAAGGGAQAQFNTQSSVQLNSSIGMTQSGVGIAAGGMETQSPMRITNTPDAAGREAAGAFTQEAPRKVPGTSAISSREAKAPPTEFQKFVLETTGRLMPIYGAEFFSASNTYASNVTPVANDYPIGPGDEVLIRAWGAIDIDYRAVVDRNGAINLPKVGTIALAGVRAGSAEDVVRAAVSKYFRGFTLTVSMGQLRGITIYVVGQAKRPGTYTVVSTSTLVTALFESGGPNANGSLRRVQVKRAGKKIAEIDLYAFLSQGDKSGDVRLIDGDVIVIPPALGHVVLTGKLETPAIYELRGQDDTLQALLEVAGGLPVLADPRRAFLERIDPTRQLPRSVEEFALSGANLSRTLKPGDLVSVLPITPEFANVVTLRGSVNQALRVPYRDGMKIVDLIPSKDFLISRNVVRRQNRSLIAQDVRDEQTKRQQFPLEQAVLDRANRTTSNQGANQGAGSSNLADGENVPGRENNNFVDSIGNLYDDLNWDYAVVERINRADMTSTLVPFNLGKALADPKGSDNIALLPGDTVSVFSAEDVRVPIAKRHVVVRVEGEVRRPGVYPVEAGETLINIIEKAGGTTPDAYVFATEFYREAVRKSQQENLDKFVRRLEQQGLSDAGRLAANTSSSDPVAAQLIQARLAAEAESRNRFIQRLRELKSTGRMTLDLPSREASFAQLPGFRLENGDRLLVPSRPDFVQVFGAVNTESALLWKPGRTVSDYLAQAGVSRDGDKDAVFVLRADGTVLSNADRWFTSVSGAEVMPGDLIVMPEKLDKESFWTTFTRSAKDITQIFSNLGLGAAAIKTLGK